MQFCLSLKIWRAPLSVSSKCSVCVVSDELTFLLSVCTNTRIVAVVILFICMFLYCDWLCLLKVGRHLPVAADE